MIILVSPAKKMDFDKDTSDLPFSQPAFTEESQLLINKLKKTSRKKIGQLMSISPALAELNYNRYQAWQLPFTPENALQAIFAFRGDVYLGFEADTLSRKDLLFAQEHLRILSGLHGILKPLDLIQAHRLEMGTSLPIQRKKNLYAYWKAPVGNYLKGELATDDAHVIINLASQEYYKVVEQSKLKARVITCHFKEMKAGELKAIMLFVKKARGMMARYIIDNRLTNPEDLKGFDRDGYNFHPALSSEDEWMFIR